MTSLSRVAVFKEVPLRSYAAHPLALTIVLTIALALVACGGSAAPTPLPPGVSTASATGPSGSATPPGRAAPQRTATAVGLDISSIDTCVLLPKADIESVFGPLGKEPKADFPNGNEKGCLYYNDRGEFADIILNPVSDWSLLREVHPDATDLTFNGDKAFSNKNPDSVSLYVLHVPKAVIHVRVSSKDLAEAKLFVPKVIARLP